jgi:hypothetical protein
LQLSCNYPNKQELIKTALEMEKQGFYLSFLLLTCYAQLEDIHRKLDTVMYECEFSQTRRAFLNLFMGKEEWDKLISDAQVHEWQEEFEAGVN